MAMENGSLKMYFLLKMWIFHCYVSLLEGNKKLGFVFSGDFLRIQSHGKSPCFTTIWENMWYFFLAFNKQIHEKTAERKKTKSTAFAAVIRR